MYSGSAGKVLYDTREVGSAVGRYVFYNELVEALRGNSEAYSVLVRMYSGSAGCRSSFSRRRRMWTSTVR